MLMFEVYLLYMKLIKLGLHHQIKNKNNPETAVVM